MTPPAAPAPLDSARVVVLAGPSGCGKTHLARQSKLPILTLDEFYRAGTDPGMPRRPDGVIDWEDPASWDAEAALEALSKLCSTGSAEVPIYEFGKDRSVGTRVMSRDRSSIVIAEGIFAAELIGPLRNRGLLADAMLVQEGRWRTFVRRLIRDLREGRKSRLYLLRQGWAKTMAEPEVIARHLALGARLTPKDQVLARLGSLASVRAAAEAA